ncbi:hypothetical protein COOONC_04474 [Cooperia oncophora]
MSGRSPVKSPARKKMATMPSTVVRDKTSSPYKLRDTSKLPSRYRDEEIDVKPLRARTPAKSRTPTKGSTTGLLKFSNVDTSPQQIPQLDVSSTLVPQLPPIILSVHRVPFKRMHRVRILSLHEKVESWSCFKKSIRMERKANPQFEPQGKSAILPISLVNSAEGNASSFPSIRGDVSEVHSGSYAAPTVVTRHSAYQQHPRVVTRVVEESYTNTPESSRSSFDDDASEATRNALLKRIARHKSQNELGTELQQSLRRIRNLLKLPKFTFGTLAPVVRQFSSRRSDKSWIKERRKVRAIYDGSFTSTANCDLSDMPPNLPAPLVVGMKVYARLRAPKDGIYGGTIDALVTGGGGYRIVFDKEDMIPPAFVPDYEVMYDGSLELLSLSYFLQQNSARLPTMNSTRTVPIPHTTKLKKSSDVSHEKVGNFPVRMLVILVKVAKLLEIKRKLVKTLTELNNEAEKESILTDVYTPVFQERYARTVVDLETVNRQINIYLNGIQEYNTQLLPHLSEVSISARPEALRRMCASHANQIVKHCNQGLNVTNPQALRLITALTSLLLQIRSLGQQKMTPVDLTALNDSINEIHQMVRICMQGLFYNVLQFSFGQNCSHPQ